MAVTPITALPPPPQRIDEPANFIAKADALVAALPQWTTQVNALGVEVQEQASEAATAAANSLGAAVAALSAANFVGEWASLSGSLSIPASVAHNGDVWLLLSNTANVAGIEPGVSANWLNITSQAWQPVQTSNFNAVPFRKYPCDMSGGGFGTTLPANPRAGDMFTFHAYGGDNEFLINHAGNTITFKGQNIDPAGDGNLILENGNTVILVATDTTTLEVT